MKKRIKWVVEIGVDPFWVEDGFNLTNDRAMDMLRNDLSFAREDELSVKVLKRPAAGVVRAIQGYSVRKKKVKPVKSKVIGIDAALEAGYIK